MRHDAATVLVALHSRTISLHAPCPYYPAQFVQSSSGSSSKRSHEASDDLLFFVTREAPTVPPPAPQPKAGRGAGKPPYFVRRKAKQLPEELQLSGASFERVDWCQSVLLNVVLQSQYSLTVVACGWVGARRVHGTRQGMGWAVLGCLPRLAGPAWEQVWSACLPLSRPITGLPPPPPPCRQESLPFVAEGRTWTPNTRTVTKPVYASPTVTAVNVDDTRAGDAQPVSCYPDICFAVDNFGDAFEDMVRCCSPGAAASKLPWRCCIGLQLTAMPHRDGGTALHAPRLCSAGSNTLCRSSAPLPTAWSAPACT